MRQWCADRYERFPVTPEDMNAYYIRFIDGQNSLALTLVNGKEIVGYITLRIPADNPTERRLGFVIVEGQCKKVVVKMWSKMTTFAT